MIAVKQHEQRANGGRNHLKKDGWGKIKGKDGGLTFLCFAVLDPGFQPPSHSRAHH
jgi:hypothetical protein